MNNMDEFREKVHVLSEIFQMAILDMTMHVREAKVEMPKQTLDKAHYVVGVAGLLSFLLEMLIAHGESFYDANKEKAHRLLQSANALAESLQAEGYGVGRVVH